MRPIHTLVDTDGSIIVTDNSHADEYLEKIITFLYTNLIRVSSNQWNLLSHFNQPHIFCLSKTYLRC